MDEAHIAAIEGGPVELHLRQVYSLDVGLTLDADLVLILGEGQARIFEDDGKRHLEVVIRRPVPAAIVRDLELLAAGKSPEGTDRTHQAIVRQEQWDGRALIDGDGAVRDQRSLPVGSLRADLRDEILAGGRALRDAAWSVARALRWRPAAHGPHRALASTRGPEWSADGSVWKRLPAEVSARVRATRQPQVRGLAKVDIERLAACGPSEPIAHELLREAEQNAYSNPRSSLVLAVAAIEAGIKAYVADVAPAAEWLAFKAPSPPVAKMIADYLPTLPGSAGARIGKPSRRIRTLIQDAVEARNNVAHTGTGEWSHEKLDELIDTARDFLYALDYFRGREWAIEHLSEQARSDWGIPHRD